MCKKPDSFSTYTKLVCSCILIFIVYLTLKYDHNVVSHGKPMMVSKQQHQNDVRPFCNVTLMGQFNYKSKKISSWSSIWSEHIKDIVIATPQGTLIDNHTYGRVMFYSEDRGMTSPYSNIVRVLKERHNINCLLYVHDDLLLTGSILRKLGRKEWISTVYNPDAAWTKNVESDMLITVYRNGTSFSHGNPQWPWALHTWTWWPGCRKTFTNMFNDADLEPYLEKSKTDEDFINVRIGKADMLYLTLLNSEQRLRLFNILELFSKHSLFLECAIPTAVFWMKTRFEIEVYNAKLCTNWDYGGLRGKPGRLFDYCNNEGTYDVFHPFKMGVISNWTDYFNVIIK